MTTMLAPILAFCTVGAIAVAATIALAAVLARRHNHHVSAQWRRTHAARGGTAYRRR